MNRQILAAEQIHSHIREQIAGNHLDIVQEVQNAIATHQLVVVGMAQNPFPRYARKLLDAADIPYQYLQYGSYITGWRRRTALKMWTGWPTFPMIFVNGMLIGGSSELEALVKSGELQHLLV
jgi:monothiol glutaredoxin